MPINAKESHVTSYFQEGYTYNFLKGVSPMRTLINLAIASVLYLGGVSLLEVFSSLDFLDDEGALIGLHLLGALLFYLYWKRELWGSARYYSFGASILLLSIGYRLLFALDTTIYGARLDTWPTAVSVDRSLLSLCFKGEAITFFGTLLLVAAWRVTVRGDIQKFSIFSGALQRSGIHYVTLFTLAVFTQVLARGVNMDFGALAQLINIIYMAGIASILFLSLSNGLAKPFICLMKSVSMAFPLSFLAWSGGMKEFIFLPFIPTALLAWLIFDGRLARLLMMVIAVSVLGLAQLYTSYVRVTAWLADSSYSTVELVVGAVTSLDEDSAAFGLNEIMSRLNSTRAHAITVALAESGGFIPREIFGGIITSFVPRIFWDEKPILRPGADHTSRISGYVQTRDEVTTGTSAGFFTELYLGGGIVGVFLFSVLNGFVIGRIQLSILFRQSGSASAIFSFMMFYYAIRYDEQSISYVLTGLALSYIMLLVIFKILSLLPARRSG
jgi:hypothetical protein